MQRISSRTERRGETPPHVAEAEGGCELQPPNSPPSHLGPDPRPLQARRGRCLPGRGPRGAHPGRGLQSKLGA